MIGAPPALAQAQKPQPGAEQSSRRTQPVKSPEERRREQLERLREMQERRRAERRAEEEAENGEAGQEPQPPEAGELDADPIRAELDPTRQIRLNFGDQPIDLSAFVDYVASTLDVNILSDEGLSGRQFKFNAPQTIPADQLLNLLGALVEQQGFALTVNEMGWYQVQPAADIAPQFDGDFATTRIIRTPLLRPSQIDALVKSQLGTGEIVRTSPIDDLGVIIATGGPKTLETYERLVLEIAGEAGEMQWHRFQLSEVAAEFAIERIIRLNSRGGGVQGAVQAQPGGQAVSQGRLIDLGERLLTDHGNTLLFRGTDAEAERLGEMISLVDTSSSLVMKRYIAGADAVDIASAGQSMGLGTVEYQQGGGGQGLQRQNIRQTPGGGRLGLGFGQQDSIANVGGSRFLVDLDTGSLLYYGTPAQHETLGKLVESFAEQAVGRRVEIKNYKLSHARAEDVAELLNELLAAPTERQGQSPFLPQAGTQQNLGGLRQQITEALQGEGEAPAEGDVSIISLEEVTIVADDVHNQILVRAPARQQAELERIIRQIDLRQPQVFIEAQIVSVTSNNSFDWAVEAEVRPGEFLLFTNFGLSGGASTETEVRSVPNSLNGVTSALIQSDYVPFIVRALENNSEQALISSPRILVNDNAEATLTSTRDEPFATTTQNAGTAVTAQGGIVSAGTTLTVEPSISSGGFLSLAYSIELSDFDSDAQQPGLAPPTNTESYDAEVTVPSDMTIVVGGLVQRNEGEVENKVPIIGDIPFLGALFKRYSQDYRYRTIFVFITPRIVYPDNAERMRLITEGPMAAVGIEDDVPRLEPVMIPIDSVDVLLRRLLPENRAPTLSSALPDADEDQPE